jgi:hypothetical protein
MDLSAEFNATTGLRRTQKYFYLSLLGVCNHKISIFPSTTGLTLWSKPKATHLGFRVLEFRPL